MKKVIIHPSAERAPKFLLEEWEERLDEIESIAMVVKIKDGPLHVDWSHQTTEQLLAKSALMQVDVGLAVLETKGEDEDEQTRN